MQIHPQGLLEKWVKWNEYFSPFLGDSPTGQTPELEGIFTFDGSNDVVSCKGMPFVD